LVNYPNPFNPSTTISFELNTEITENTEIEIYNVKGQRIREFKMENVKRKMNKVTWNGTNQQKNPVASGVYFAVLKAEDGRVWASRKMILLK